jgi:hypothetical protein
LNRVPFGKFKGVNVLIRGGLLFMRDVSFLVRLPEEQPASKGPGIFWKKLARYLGISRPSVLQAIKRGKKFAKEDDVKLLN